MAITFEDLTPRDRAQIQDLWMRQFWAKRVSGSGEGRRKTDKKVGRLAPMVWPMKGGHKRGLRA